MTGMSMNKVIHRAVRRDLVRFENALHDFKDGDSARAADLHRAWENFDWQLTHHHEGEHEIAWPALRELGISEDDINQFDDEHEAMAAALAEARNRMATLAKVPTRAEANAAALAMGQLSHVTIAHLDAEEEVSEPLFAEHADHPAIKDMAQKFGKSQSIKSAGGFFAWLQDGASPEELAALKADIPGPVLAILTKVFGRRYSKEIASVWR